MDPFTHNIDNGFLRGHRLPVSILQRHVKLKTTQAFPACMLHSRSHFHRRIPVLFGQQAVGGSPLRQMHLTGFHQPHITVDARTRVPAGIRIPAMIHAHRQHILPLLQIRSQFIHKRDVAVWALAQQMTVEINLAAVIHALKIEVGEGRVLGGNILEMFPIPGDAGRKIARAAGILG